VPPGERKTTLIINTATCEPDRMSALAARIAPRGLAFMELPLSGSSDQVARGEALGLVGDNGGVYETARDIVASIAPQHVQTGPVGNGAKTKLAINHVLAVNRAALAEGLVFAERIGLSPEVFLAAVKQSAAYSQVMDIKGAKMLAGDFSPQGRIRQSLKDITMIVAEAEARGQTLPLAEVYKQLMQAGVDAGEGDLDNASVIAVIRRLGP
jgi:3-hydroxyisobutyrate dehydrogenase-like beta-hydroxyacid dehydrogenase